MFDRCPEAIEEAVYNNINSDKIKLSDICKVQDYVFDEAYTYNAIYIRWFFGYLSK